MPGSERLAGVPLKRSVRRLGERMRPLFVLVAVSMLVGLVAHADHWPEELMAAGPPDKALLGQEVGRAQIGPLLSTLGRPTEASAPRTSLDRKEGQSEYRWQRADATIQVDCEWYLRADGARVETIFEISIEAPHTSTQYATDRGLRIGDSRQKMFKLYGHVYQLSKSATQERYCYCFGDESKAYITVDRTNRVVGLALEASVE